MPLLEISPYIAWKGISTNSIAPSYSRPDLTVAGPAFKANPIRQWRKQLIPTTNSGNPNRRAGVGMPMDIPDGSIYLGNVPENTNCLRNATDVGAAGLKENMEKYDNINCNTTAGDCYFDVSNNRMVRITGPRRIKPATTILSKKYYTDHEAYMRSRCLTFDQKLTANPIAGVTYLDANGVLQYPNDTNVNRNTQDCPATCPTQTSCQTIYKPNNIQYAKQGAVDSSDRLTRLKLNTINKNAASYKEVFGSSASRYLGMASTPYFTKSKYQACVQKDCAKIVNPVPSVYPLDLTFNRIGTNVNGIGFDNFVNFVDIAVQTDDKIVVGGEFLHYNNISCNYITRLNADGSLDTDFVNNNGSGFDSSVYSVQIQKLGLGEEKFIVIGQFTIFNGNPIGYIARINHDGTFDNTFNTGSGFNNKTFGLAVQPWDGKIVVAGDFTDFNGNTVGHIARLNSDGTFDASFNEGGAGFAAIDAISFSIAITLQPITHKIIIVGLFSDYSTNTCNSILQLDPSGNFDDDFYINNGTGFDTSPYYPQVLAIQHVDSDYKILVGGFNLSSFDGHTCNGILRLNSDGTLDTTFTNNIVNVFIPFDIINFAIALQPDGKILISGYVGSGTLYIARLNSDGTIDTIFIPITIFDGPIFSMALQSTGKIIVGGFFQNYGAVPVGNIARLYNA